MKPRAFVILVGLALIVAGFIIGLVGTSVTAQVTNPFNTQLTSAESVDCGGLFSPGSLRITPFGASQAVVTGQCDAAIGSQAVWVWVLMGLGVLVVAGGVFVKTVRPAVAPPPALLGP